MIFRESDHTYWEGTIRYPSVTEILQAEGLVDTTWFDEWSRTKGTYVHRAIELYNKGELLEKDLDERLAPYLDAWRRFKENSDIDIIDSELVVYSEIWQYAGTLDIFCRINRENSIIDLKSGAVNAVTALQLAGYAMTFDNYYCIKLYGLSLKGGRPSIVAFTDPADFTIFQAIVGIYHYKLNNGIIKK